MLINKYRYGLCIVVAFLFLSNMPSILFAMGQGEVTAPVGASQSVFQHDVGSLAPVDGNSFYEKVEAVVPDDTVRAYQDSMPSLLQAICAYHKSPDSRDPETQIRSFHKFLLVGQEDASTMAVVMGQDFGCEIGVCDAQSLQGGGYGQTAIKAQALFQALRSKAGRMMFVFKNLDKLFAGHPEEDYIFSGNMDDFERRNSNIIFAITVSRADIFSSHFKSRFRTQYVQVPRVIGTSGLEAALSQSDIGAVADATADRSDDKAEDEDVPVEVRPEEIQALAERGLSHRDRVLLVDAMKIFAHRDAERTADGKLVIKQDHQMRAYAQLLDKGKVLDCYETAATAAFIAGMAMPIP